MQSNGFRIFEMKNITEINVAIFHPGAKRLSTNFKVDLLRLLVWFIPYKFVFSAYIIVDFRVILFNILAAFIILNLSA